MKFRNYCVVIMGETDDVIDEIRQVSEMEPNILSAKGILISTFSSIIDPKELTDYFRSNGRNFLIFDLNPDNSGYFIVKENINEGLFGFLRKMNENALIEKTNNLINELTSSTVSDVTIVKKKEKSISVEEIPKMGAMERNNLMNQLIDKGFENFSEQDKLVLDKLAKYL